MNVRIAGVLVGLAVSAAAAAMPPVGTQYPSRVFKIQPDTRRCISPLCGGFWIAPVNGSRMMCPDGVRRASCYVASAEWSLLGLDPTTEASLDAAARQEEALVEGVVEIQSVSGYVLPVLLPSRAWWDVTFVP